MVEQQSVNILVAGDFSPYGRLQNLINNKSFDNLFSSVKPVVNSHDTFVVNFETVVKADDNSPIKKIGAHLSTNENAIEALKWLGVNVVTLANNHFMDYGQSAAENTQRKLGEAAIQYVGTGENLKDAQRFLELDIKGRRITIINACEHEFSVAGSDQFGCNPINTIELYYQVKEAKRVSDNVICILHGGNEHYQLPSPRMKQLYRFLIDSGADAVINHHQHCFSGYELYKGKPIFYGLGNFCFDSASDNKYRHKTWNYGYLVSLHLNSEEVSFELIPYEQCWEKPGTFVYQDDESKNKFFSEINELNQIIVDDKLLTERFRQLALSRRDVLYSGFRPYSGRILTALYAKGLLPSFLTKKRLTLIKAFLDCEAHHEMLMYGLSADDLSSKPKL